MTRMMTTTTAVIVLVAAAAAAMMMEAVVMKEVGMSAVKPFVQSRDPSKVQGTCRTSRFVHACHHCQ